MNEIIANPNGNQAAALDMCHYIETRKGELRAKADALLASIDETNWNAPETKAAVEEIADAVEDLRDSGKRLVKEVCAATEAQRVLTAIDARLWTYSTKADPNCAYGVLAAAVKAIKAKVAAFKDAATPKEPPRAWVVRMDMNGKQFEAMAKAAEKNGCPFVMFAVPQGDKATKQIQKWFEENV